MERRKESIDDDYEKEYHLHIFDISIEFDVSQNQTNELNSTWITNGMYFAI